MADGCRTTTPQPRTGPLPARVSAILARQLFIVKDGVPSPLLNQIKRLAAFQNPEFYKRQSMRLSTAMIPRVISCANELPGHVALPRGCRTDLEVLLGANDVALDILDERVVGAALEVRFQGHSRLFKNPQRRRSWRTIPASSSPPRVLARRWWAPTWSRRLNDPPPAGMPDAVLNQKARSYRGANCGFCHRPDVNDQGFDLRYTLTLKETNICNLMEQNGIPPMPQTQYADLAPGNHAASAMWIRMNIAIPDNPGTQDYGRMPCVATNIVDQQGTALIGSLIDSIKTCP